MITFVFQKHPPSNSMAKAVGELQDQRKGRHKLLGTRSEGEMVGMEGRGQSQEAERREETVSRTSQ